VDQTVAENVFDLCGWGEVGVDRADVRSAGESLLHPPQREREGATAVGETDLSLKIKSLN